jgi:2-haloacid dehalogenase
MPFTRRDLFLGAAGILASCSAPDRSLRKVPSSVRAVAFDAFVLFDPRPFASALEAAFPGRGAAVWAGFRSRLFDYGWLRALGGRYEDFWRVSEDALDAALEAENLTVTAAARASLLERWDSLPPWPDAVRGVRELSRRGLRLAVLSNWSPRMLERALARSGLKDAVRALSTDEARTYKPAPAAYALGPIAFGLDRREILFVAFAGWDAAGAAWFGFPTAWMNRAGAPRDRLDLDGVALATSFADLTIPG